MVLLSVQVKVAKHGLKTEMVLFFSAHLLFTNCVISLDSKRDFDFSYIQLVSLLTPALLDSGFAFTVIHNKI